MQPDRFTIKSQEALEAAQRLAAERRNPQTRPEHLLAVLLEQDGGVVVPVLRKLGVDPAAVRATLGPALEALPRLTERRQRADRRLQRADRGAARRRGGDARARGRVRLDRAPRARACQVQGHDRRRAALGRRRLRAAAEGRQRGARRPARHRPEPRGQVPGAREVRPRPDPGRRRRQARPGDRARR